MCINKTEQNIEKIIWIYWAQGWENAPNIVKECRKSWEHYNPDWEIRCLDQNSVIPYFDIKQWMPGPTPSGPQWLIKLREKLHALLHSTHLIKRKRVKIQHRADIIRVNLLQQYGGVWADATLWCNKPLSDWVNKHTHHGFFAFSNPGHQLNDGDTALFSSYFLISEKGGHVISTLSDAIFQYWKINNQEDEYFWINTLFNNLYKKDKKFRSIWDKTEKIDAPVDANYGPEYFAWYKDNQLTGISDDFIKIIDSGCPAFKLTNRKKNSIDRFDKIQYLFNTIKNGQNQ